ncbi:MAG: tetratricopeptide repeat protein [Bryobacteraceae bacterium]
MWGLAALALCAGAAQQPAPSLRQWIERAREAEQKEDLASAAAAYREILRIKPGWGSAELNLALVLNSQKQYASALDYFDRALRHDASLGSAHLGRGVALFNLERFAEAAGPLGTYAKGHPDDTDVHFYLGRTFESTGDYTRAIAWLQRQLQLTPRNHEALFHLGECGRMLAGAIAQRLATDPDAVYYFTLLTAEEPRAKEEAAAVESRIRDAIGKNPDAAEGYVALGLHQLKSGQRKEAAASFQEAWKRNSADCRISSTCTEERDAAAGFASTGTAASSYDTFQRARRLAEASYRRLADGFPESPLAAQARAHLLQQNGRLAEAGENYRRAIELSGRSVASLVDYARFLSAQGEFERALALLDEARKTEPSSATIRALSGEVHVMKDDPAGAIPHLEAALAARPADAQTRSYLAQSLAKLNRVAEAVRVLEKAPEDPDGRIHYLLGSLYRRLGQQEKAEKAFEIFRSRKGAR